MEDFKGNVLEQYRLQVLREYASNPNGKLIPFIEIANKCGIPEKYIEVVRKSLGNDGLIRCYNGDPQPCILDANGRLYLAEIDLGAAKDSNVVMDFSGNKGIIIQDSDLHNSPVQKVKNQDSDFLDSPATQSVKTTPSIKDNTNGKSWLPISPLFIYFIYPIIAGLIISYFVFFFEWN